MRTLFPTNDISFGLDDGTDDGTSLSRDSHLVSLFVVCTGLAERRMVNLG